MTRCDRCKNKPTEFFPSRWYKQIFFLMTFRKRWRCARCGKAVVHWVWDPPPPNNVFHSPHLTNTPYARVAMWSQARRMIRRIRQ
ncbi:MAG: hypothetical protein CBB71_20365 [Rhodopirellula sp. TMED11]|uniref:hypothetical protein n=1 Tax=Stieleria bergensis TaxID=2528025 RepID=UPI000B761154|nr:MAG: hypothetical protein CBB71_20365 [Rhodopirellula sp. TMED11]